MLAAKPQRGRPPLAPTLCRVRIRLCAANCRHCFHGHQFTDVLDATRISKRMVKVTTPDPVWFGAELHHHEVEFVRDE